MVKLRATVVKSGPRWRINKYIMYEAVTVVLRETFNYGPFFQVT